VKNQDQRAAVAARMMDQWKRMVSAKANGDWPEYWAYRHAWLASGRLLAVLQDQDREQRPEQLSLVPPEVGRLHDTAS